MGIAVRGMRRLLVVVRLRKFYSYCSGFGLFGVVLTDDGGEIGAGVGLRPITVRRRMGAKLGLGTVRVRVIRGMGLVGCCFS